MKLPYGLRALIWSTYEIGQEQRMDPSEDYLDAAHEVQEWIAEHYPEGAA
jgi:hypothetical protein